MVEVEFQPVGPPARTLLPGQVVVGMDDRANA
jgi:hypothetical protein